ncbi:MAG: ribosome biogenesis GTP-binding protein YihA/YsxC [Paludibacteraceae bacterium]|nr:ribosome biogenesis GTP-binding protein YihA/YsxC [Bacteroidales bacterium]MDY4148137.1 ribosome biogenesis GTP-binding protein YihA/YsxC [Paludibacteraceae bacterium]
MIQNAQFVISSPDVSDCPQSNLPEYAFIGRSNVGKSSLINMLAHNPKLAKTSQKPGKTLLINHFIINANTPEAWHLVDLPGYGYAQAGQQQRAKLKQMIERYCLLREPLCSLFVLVDCRHEPQKIDMEFMEWLGENEVPFAIVFTKGDKVGKGRLKENVEAYKAKMLETWVELPPIFVTSAESGMGGEEIVRYIESINQDIQSQNP